MTETQVSAEDLDFDRAIALTPAGEGRMRGEVHPGWDIRGNPHGGYLLALVAAAARSAVPQPHPLSVAATFLAPPEFAPTELTVDVARIGKRQSTATVKLVQGDRERVRATVTMGTLLDADPEILADDVVRPSGLDPDDAARVRHQNAEIGLHQRVELRMAPEVGFLRGEPSGPARIDGWLRFADGRAPDPLGLLLFSDGFPPSIFEARGPDIGHVPTVQLTTHLFALPTPGWIQGSFRSRVQGGSLIDEDGELWDQSGRLVATARQMALLR